MSDLEEFLRAASERTGESETEILARVLHVDTDALNHVRSIVPTMPEPIAALMSRLDYEIRVRNPGVHYVCRSTYLGYRRERLTGAATGARSQVFLSVVPKTRLLKLLFVPPEGAPPGMAQPLAERGHHGVGTSECVLRTGEDLDRFLADFDALLSPIWRRPCL